LRLLGALAVCTLVMAGCAAPLRNSRPAPPLESSYVVKPDDTLYGIAWRHGLDYRELARLNHLGPDFRILVGQRLILRPVDTPVAAAAPVTPPRADRPPTQAPAA
jgi:lipoprotein NlpD